MAALMSRKAYARYRGCDPAAVRYAIRKGWIVPDPVSGDIDPAQADRGWPLERRHGPWVLPELDTRPDPELGGGPGVR
jgi:hypothetical protein